MMFTERDRKLFHLLGQVRLMTLKQIQEYVFAGASRSIVQRRLGLFRKRSVLRSVQSSRYGQLAWTLCAETARAIDVDPRAFTRNPNLYCIEHDLMLSEIALHWLRHGVIDNWKAAIHFEIENSGRNSAKAPHIPDAQVWSSQFSGYTFIEYENSLKTRVDLRRVLRHYNESFFDQVFYFWRNQSVANLLRNARDLRKRENHHIWLADHSIEAGIPNSFTCLITGEKLDLKISAEIDTAPVAQPDSTPASRWSIP